MESRQRKTRILSMLEKYDKKLLRFYLNNGPIELKKRLDIGSEEVWRIVFDYLMFEKNAIQVCIGNNPNYIYDIFANKGPEFLRKAFKLENCRYDEIWQYVVDYIGISRGALFSYVNKESSTYKNLILNGKTTEIRKKLQIDFKKYDKIWEEVLDILLECISFHNFTFSQFEQGLRFFTNMYNSGRKHRSLNTKNEA